MQICQKEKKTKKPDKKILKINQNLYLYRSRFMHFSNDFWLKHTLIKCEDADKLPEIVLIIIGYEIYLISVRNYLSVIKVVLGSKI